MSSTVSEDEPVIKARGLTKIFGSKTVVDHVDLSVRKGEIYGFLGPNGSGKTTFIRMLCGLLKPDDGNGTCLGYDILTQSEQIKPKVGYMAQKFSLYTDLTVRENLEFTARVYGLNNIGKSVADQIEKTGLGRFEKQLAGSLSGGWKQRLALAACTLHSPNLLLLDEPTAGVDPSARRDFWDQIHALAAEGITALISTHYMDEAERCRRLAYIAYGNLLAKGTPDELTRNSGLTTWAVSGGDIHALGRELEGKPGVDQAAAFGVKLHVSTRDEAALERTMAPYRKPPYTWQQIETSLEETFIDLMRGVSN